MASHATPDEFARPVVLDVPTGPRFVATMLGSHKSESDVKGALTREAEAFWAERTVPVAT